MKDLCAYRLICLIGIIGNLLTQAATGGKPQFYVASQVWMAAYIILTVLDHKQNA